MINRKILLSGLSVLSLALCGCSLLTSNEKPPTIYNLQTVNAPLPVVSSSTGRPIVISVVKPSLPAGFETDQIALYLDNGKRMDYYAAAKWASPLDDLIQENIIKAGRMNLPNQIIDTSDLSIPADYKLVTALADFQPVYGPSAKGLPRIDVTLIVTLLSMPDENVVRYFTLKQSLPGRANNLTYITNEMSMQLQAMLDETFSRIGPGLKKQRVGNAE